MAFSEKIPQHKILCKIREVSLDELLNRCIQGDRSAWEEFFHRYIPLIKKAINQKIKGQAETESIKEDIFEQIVTDLCRDKLLEECGDRKGFHQWIAKVSANRTISWLRAKDRLKRLPEKAYNENAVPLSTPLASGSSATLIDVLLSPQKSTPALAREAESALETLENLSNWKQKWIFRLCIAGQCPLMEDEKDVLYSQCEHDYETFTSLCADIEKDLDSKDNEKQQAAGRAEILWYQIRRLEARLLECTEEQQDALRKEIATLGKRRERHLHTANRLIQPRHSLIARILGIGEDKADQISGLLARAREALIKKHHGRSL